ncbi:hypothetical protein [Pseudomonas sp. TAE6080]|uniref:hypothetical protein n=1 Tax=Pseudomonas sp. TAE6080 TaxID=2840374 RepID=UPI001C003AAC|nr:hypothetical protein [Pseudomonas sp. TAE6080]MBT9299490.1 hypothetical protein [Pseudomonas sp. TAE6080]
MANKVKVNFKGTKKTHTSNISVEDLPNTGDFVIMDGERYKIIEKTFIYDANGLVESITLDLESA